MVHPTRDRVCTSRALRIGCNALAGDRATSSWLPYMTPPAEDLSRVYPSTHVGAREAREFIATELRRADASNLAVDDFVLIVSELVTNSIQHGDGSGIIVRIDRDSGPSFAVTVGSGVASMRPPMDPDAWTVAPTDHRSGRGLGIVRQLSDSITVTLDQGRLDITCRRSR